MPQSELLGSTAISIGYSNSSNKYRDAYRVIPLMIPKFQVIHSISGYFIGVATLVQGTIVQGDSCPWDFCPMTQLSKESFVQCDFYPKKLLPDKSLLKKDFSYFLLKVTIFIDYRMK